MSDKTKTAGQANKKPGFIKKLLGRDKTIIPVVRLHGTISADQRPGRINIAAVNPLLEKAFGIKRAPVVAIVINSPGGSPVQSRLVARRIRDLAAKHEKKVLVFVEDVAASGGYFIAVAGDEIIADPSSIVGSIGVIFAGFGFVEAIDKLGIQRRVHTAGRNKSQLDPFLPENKKDIERLKGFELDVHQVFIDFVKHHRTGKLRAEDDELFTGEWWTAIRGLELGLIDGLGDMHSTLRERYGEDIELKLIAPKKGLLQLPRLGFGAGLDAGAMVSDALVAVEDRALWARFGL